MIVVPSSFSFFNRSMIIFPWLEWRLPVGSSARISFGFPMIARATATSLLLSSGKLIRIERFLAHDLEAVEDVRHQLPWRSDLLDVAIRQRQIEILLDGEVIEQMILLEDKAHVLLVQLDPVAIIELVNGVLELNRIRLASLRPAFPGLPSTWISRHRTVP